VLLTRAAVNNQNEGDVPVIPGHPNAFEYIIKTPPRAKSSGHNSLTPCQYRPAVCANPSRPTCYWRNTCCQRKKSTSEEPGKGPWNQRKWLPGAGRVLWTIPERLESPRSTILATTKIRGLQVAVQNRLGYSIVLRSSLCETLCRQVNLGRLPPCMPRVLLIIRNACLKLKIIQVGGIAPDPPSQHRPSLLNVGRSCCKPIL